MSFALAFFIKTFLFTLGANRMSPDNGCPLYKFPICAYTISKQRGYPLLYTEDHMRLPNHIGIIPDGNRRWAVGQGLHKQDGYDRGISPGLTLYRACRDLGIREMSFYGFTADNAKRPVAQRRAFTSACVKAVEVLSHEDAALLVLGNAGSASFPPELLPYTTRRVFGDGRMNINFLVNYSLEWDLGMKKGAIGPALRTAGLPRVDQIGRASCRERV